jgi:hypothetical protein
MKGTIKCFRVNEIQKKYLETNLNEISQDYKVSKFDILFECTRFIIGTNPELLVKLINNIKMRKLWTQH